MRPAIISPKRGGDSSRILREKDFSVKGLLSTQQVHPTSSNYPNYRLPYRVDSTSESRRKNNQGSYCFTMQDLLGYFFGRTKCRGQDCLPRPECSREIESQNGVCCSVCQQGTSEKCPMHGPLQSLRNLVKAQPFKPGTKNKMQLSYAVTSFPREVQLCESSIPGHCYGVSARQFIPIGTWIGPYEGVRLNAGDLRPGTDTSYMWEIYQDGKITSYINGIDENLSSWMRFIRCARHKLEQNLTAFQYCGNIYYRAFKDISPETELLVWYDDQYDQFLGIPVALRESNTMASGHLLPQDMDHSPSTLGHLYSAPSNIHHLMTPNCDTVRRPVTTTENDVNESPAIESFSVLTKTTELAENTADTNTLNPRCNVSPNADHLESGIWRCGQCFKSFTQRSLLQIHVCPRLPEKPYQCGHCAQSFSHPTDLRTHVVTHNSERPFKCGFCGRSFAGSTTLNNHIRTHTGEKPFVCEKCGRPFSQASQLSRHQRLPGECHRNDVY